MPAWHTLVLLLLLPFAVAAQVGARKEVASVHDPLFSTRHFTTKDGLPHRVVNSIAQDQRGFIWLGTPQGLARFDGDHFMTLTTSEGLGNDAVRNVVCDRHGMLIICYTNGVLEVLDPVGLRVSSFTAYMGGALSETAGTVNDVMRMEDGTIVMATTTQLYWYGNKQDGLRSARVACNGWVDQLRRDVGSKLWCSCHLKPGVDWPVELIRLDLQADPMSANAHESIHMKATVGLITDRGTDHYPFRTADAQGTYALLKGGNALHNWWVPSDSTPSDPPAMTTRAVLYNDARNVFRMRLTDELWLVSTRIRRMQVGQDPETAPVVFDLADVVTNADLAQLDVLRDRIGNLWVGGEFGLFQVTMRPDRFSRFLWNGSSQNMGEHRIRGMEVHGGRLHVNTEISGYWILDPYTGEELGRDKLTVFRGDITSDGADGLARCELDRLIHQDASGRQYRVITAAETLPRYYVTWSALPLGDGAHMLGLLWGLRRTYPQGDSSIIVASGSADLDRAWVAHLFRLDAQRILVSSNAGLFLVDTQGRMLERWWTGAPTADKHHLPTDDIRFAYRDSTGTFWLATGSQGLLRWDMGSGVVQKAGRAEGFPTASIHAIMPDRRGHLWMPTDNGLVRYHVASGDVKVYTTADGLGFDEFNRLAYAQGPDGRMYFGGLNGITAFHPDDLSDPLTSVSAPLVLKSIKLQREEGDRSEDLTADVLAGTKVSMEPKDRFIAIDVALLSYEDPALVTYAWRIDGIDSDWNLQRGSSLRFTSLPYGDHVLRIKAQDAEGRWSEELNLPITRLRPLHLRWWFLLLCALLLAAAIFAFVRYREQQLRRMIHMRDRIATDLHDEVGSNLSSIVLFSTAVGKHADELPEYAADMLHRIKDNSKRAMESMNDIVWSVNSGHDSMEDLLDRMRAYAEPLCEAAGIRLEFVIDAGPLTRKLAMDQRKNLYLIFKEAVSNAVRHSRCQQLAVSLRLVNGQYELVVDDDGTGLHPDATRGASLGGNGLGNMVRRAQEIGGEVRVLAGEASGTRVVFRFVPVDE
ncbi:MAG: hypothetical protein JNN32_04255 [Flavobacteriales bacterium]|nr:hypothetical protein [Flavobacteriales bacterium]